MKPTNLVDMSDEQCRALLALGTGFGGLDFQAARFAFVLFAIDRFKRCIRVDEYYSQFEGLKVRAKFIHELCEFYGITGFLPVWSDAANPQDIMEMNAHWVEGWVKCDACGALWPTMGKRCDNRECRGKGPGQPGEPMHVTSKIRCGAVAQENKLRRVAVERINDALDRDILLYRTGIEYDWMLGRTSTEEGVPQHSSRLLWEAENWSYPKMAPGKSQDEDPDDHTADGADFMAAQRYALMSYWRQAKFPHDYGKYEDDRGHPFDYKKRQFVEPPHAFDELQGAGRALRAPRVIAPRPRGIR
jgi:hypothetical protein